MEVVHRVQAIWARTRLSTVVSAAGVTAGVGLYFQHCVAQQATMQRAHDELVKHVTEATEGALKNLTALKDSVDAAVRAKDTALQKMDLQNIEQTRSIDRLIVALKTCRVQLPPELSRSTAVTARKPQEAPPAVPTVVVEAPEAEGTAIITTPREG